MSPQETHLFVLGFAAALVNALTLLHLLRVILSERD